MYSTVQYRFIILSMNKIFFRNILHSCSSKVTQLNKLSCPEKEKNYFLTIFPPFWET